MQHRSIRQLYYLVCVDSCIQLLYDPVVVFVRMTLSEAAARINVLLWAFLGRTASAAEQPIGVVALVVQLIP